MIKVAILDDYQDAALRFADWPDLAEGVEITVHRSPIPQETAADALAEADVIVAMRERMRFDVRLLAQLPRLRLIVTSGMVNAAIDMHAATAQGITVCGTRSVPSPTPELTWGLLLALARDIPGEAASVRNGGWQTGVGLDLAGKVIGVVGIGKVGRVVARYARAFDMQVLAWSPNLTAERAAEAGAEMALSLHALLARADVVSLHMVLSERTRGLISAAELAVMKPGALLLNTSRGPLIDSAALVEALRSGHLRGAALDVFDAEPLPQNDVLRTLDRVIATPHIGYVTEANYHLYHGDAVEDIRTWMAGQPVRVIGAPGENVK